MLFLCAVTKDSAITLHILGLLKDVLADFPATVLKTTVEIIMKNMVLADPLTTTVGLKALNGLFSAHPPESRLDFDLNAQLINVRSSFRNCCIFLNSCLFCHRLI